MANISNVSQIRDLLMKEWNSKSRSLKKCEELLSKAKVLLMGTSFLPTVSGEASREELLLARDILEVGVQCAVERADVPAFERYMLQLKSYYTDYKECGLPESTYQLPLLGLNLMSLLVQSKVGEFHTELELLSPAAVANSVYIKYPVMLEQYLMEGNYNKIRLSRDSVPAPHYRFFVQQLLSSIKDEMAQCMENAYERMSTAETARMLELDGPQQLAAFSKQRGWLLDKSEFVVFSPSSAAGKRDSTVSPHHSDHYASVELAQQTIEYARQLEMIV